jgi:predicted ribosomally synthesized peptide with nif11-like leader
MVVSVATARKFLELVASDDALQTQLDTSNPVGAEEIVKFAHTKGFIFTEEDLHTALDDFREGRVEARIGAKSSE